MPTNSVSSLSVTVYAAARLSRRIQSRLDHIRVEMINSHATQQFDRNYARTIALFRVRRWLDTAMQQAAFADPDQHQVNLHHAKERHEILRVIVDRKKAVYSVIELVNTAMQKTGVDVDVLTERYVIWALQTQLELPEWVVEILNSEHLM